ncbi:MAG: 2,3-cyclic 3-phosphodiesterase [Gaiellales bacterium]|jgi:2'-5' RNA ligase|nr:2,3-cyclic 3-phosphodiesterase [Gaiellales bacterium]
MLLFTALLPPEHVVVALRGELDRLGAWGSDDVRWSPPHQWHITLAFYGEHHDSASLAELLADRLRGSEAPRVWLEGAGTFPGVLLLRVGGEGLTELADDAGAGQGGREYRPHLTLGRMAREARTPWEQRLAEYRTEPWTAREVVLMRSDRTEGGPHYRVVGTYQLTCGRHSSSAG